MWTWAGETRFSPDRNLDDSLPKLMDVSHFMGLDHFSGK